MQGLCGLTQFFIAVAEGSWRTSIKSVCFVCGLCLKTQQCLLQRAVQEAFQVVQGGVMHVNLVLAGVLHRLMTASVIAMPVGGAAGEPGAG
jgi:hypothetical protein